MGLDVTNNIVVIDEAHNLLQAIKGAHSVSMTSGSLASMAELLSAYLTRFQSHLGASKATAVTLALGLAERVRTFLDACTARVR
jgi:chromosome transmission fidelity protein 1